MIKKQNKTNQANQQYLSFETPFCFITTLVFLILKLIHVIDWSWWWIFAPLWMPVAGFILIVVIGIIIALIVNKVIK